jgi:P22 coat protein - gene protein 5
MANTLTGLIPTIYRAADTVARELIGFIPAVYKDSDVEQVAKDQNITYPIVAAQTAGDITPAATGPNPSGQTVTTGTMTISKSRSVAFPWNGEEQASIRQVYAQTLEAQFAQSMRTLCNEIETDLFIAAKAGASRAYGTAGTTPFPTVNVLTDFAETKLILDENGAPSTDRHLVLSGAAATKILSVQASLFKVNEAGSDSMLRTGSLGRVEGFDLHQSSQIVSHTKGTGASYVFNGSHAVGVTTIAADTGTGTLLAGDVLAFEDDTRKYVANSALGSGSFTIGGPGLRQAQVDAKTITIGNNYTGNWAFERNALHLITRLPKMPDGGDSADDVIEITDPLSGLSFQVVLYRQYRQVSYEVGIAWGTKAVKSNFIALLLG